MKFWCWNVEKYLLLFEKTYKRGILKCLSWNQIIQSRRVLLSLKYIPFFKITSFLRFLELNWRHFKPFNDMNLEWLHRHTLLLKSDGLSLSLGFIANCSKRSPFSRLLFRFLHLMAILWVNLGMQCCPLPFCDSSFLCVEFGSLSWTVCLLIVIHKIHKI